MAELIDGELYKFDWWCCVEGISKQTNWGSAERARAWLREHHAEVVFINTTFQNPKDVYGYLIINGVRNGYIYRR